MDFDAIHGIYKDNLFITFPLRKIKILKLLKKKKTTEPFFHELVTLGNCKYERNIYIHLGGFSMGNCSCNRYNKIKVPFNLLL